MPYAGDGTRQYRQRLRRKEVGGQIGGQSGILHTHLYTDGALLRYIETGHSAGHPTQQVSQCVVTEDNGECPDEKTETAYHKIIVHSTDYTAYNQCQTDNTRARHERLDGRKTFFLAVHVIEQTTQCHRYDGHDQDIQKHPHRVYPDNRPSSEFHEERCHHRCQNGGCAGHTHRECHITVTEIRHDIARHTARTTAHKQYTDGESRFEMEHMHQQVSHTRHNNKLRTGSDKDIHRPPGEYSEVGGGQRQSHGKHDQTKHDSLRDSRNPFEC